MKLYKLKTKETEAFEIMKDYHKIITLHCIFTPPLRYKGTLSKNVFFRGQSFLGRFVGDVLHGGTNDPIMSRVE